jgi:hypothetical protein
MPVSQYASEPVSQLMKVVPFLLLVKGRRNLLPLMVKIDSMPLLVHWHTYKAALALQPR